MIEVLVVVSIVLFLLAMLVPGMGLVRERVRRVVCANNLRQWGIALGYHLDEHDDYLPMEGKTLNSQNPDGGLNDPKAWYNALPPYLGLPPYRDLEGANKAIRELPAMHPWICPAKNNSDYYKSEYLKGGIGKNQFHYGMNEVLDGMGNGDSPDTPDYPDAVPSREIPARIFATKPYTVFMFDIFPNSPCGSPRDAATKFHRNYANVLYVSGAVGDCSTDDLVTNRDFVHGKIIWDHPTLYWGYPPP